MELTDNHIIMLKILYESEPLCAKKINGQFSDSARYRMLNDLENDGLAKHHLGRSVRYKRRTVKMFSLTEKGRVYCRNLSAEESVIG